jgi:branched-chain amino acid transport system permease protein
MTARLRFFALASLGLLVITFPFLWLKLIYNFSNGTVGIDWNPENGLNFFQNLIPVFVIALLFVALNWLEKKARWQESLGRALSPLRNITSQAWWRPVLLFLVLDGVFFLNDKYLGLAIMMGIYMIQAVGLNITVGMTGLLVIGYAAFYAFGAYCFAVAQMHIPGLQWWEAAPLIFIMGGILGWLIGLPCLRLRGDYLAIVSLGFAESFRELMRNLAITGGDKGITILPASQLVKLPYLTLQQTKYALVTVFVFMVVFIVRRIYRSPIGRTWVAIREDETAASAMGVPIVRMKLFAFALSAAFAALAGLLYVVHVGFIDPAAGAFEQSVMVLAMVILGGLGSIEGALLGSAVLFLVPEFLRDSDFLLRISPQFSDYRLFIFGGIMVAMMLIRPQGLMGSRRRQLEIDPES